MTVCELRKLLRGQSGNTQVVFGVTRYASDGMHSIKMDSPVLERPIDKKCKRITLRFWTGKHL